VRDSHPESLLRRVDLHTVNSAQKRQGPAKIGEVPECESKKGTRWRGAMPEKPYKGKRGTADTGSLQPGPAQKTQKKKREPRRG